MKYEAVIGLEVHAQVHTASKMFCACPVVEDMPPNTSVCPICTGMPGTLPTINRRAVELTIMTGLALHCEIPPTSRFARKSYFYPDLPKGYQISQHRMPLAVNGYLEIKAGETPRRIPINNVHLEEDTGKLHHRGETSLVDYNRAGIPLIEIVTEPAMRSVEEVRAFATQLREILVYLGVNAGDLEKGMMRFEASVSVRPVGVQRLYPRHEIKNLNAFSALAQAVGYEIDHQIQALRTGGRVSQQTMGWDETKGVTYVQRSKEQLHDYRYFPEPDLPPLEIHREWVEQLSAQLPELPQARRARFIAEYGLSDFEADLLVADQAIADFYEAAVARTEVDPPSIAHWITGPLFQLMNQTGQGIDQVPLSPQALVELVELVEAGTINRTTGREVVWERMVATGRGARQIVEEEGLVQIADRAKLGEIIQRVLDDHPPQVQQYLDGKEQVIGWLMGRLMAATRGQAHPQMARRLLKERLEARRT